VRSRGRDFVALIRDRRYLLWLLSSDAANVGYSIYAITILWISYRISGSLVLAGIVLLVEIGTYTMTFLFGPLVDRVPNKRTIFLVCYPVQAVAAFALGFEFLAGTLSIPVLLGIVAVLSVLWDIVWAAYQVVPRLVVGRDKLFQASGIGGIVSGGNQIAGYALGGALIVLVGPGEGALLYGSLLLAALACSIPLSLPTPPAAAPPTGSEFREGWRPFRPGDPSGLFELGIQEIAFGFFSAGPALLITLQANVAFVQHALTYGVLFTAFIVGGVIAGLALGWVNPRRRVGVLIIGGLVATGAALVLASLAPPLLVASAVAWYLVGVTNTVHFTARTNYVQGRFPPELLARISSNLYVFTGSASAVGAVTLAYLSPRLSPTAFGMLIAGGWLAAALVASVFPRIRQLSY
jgi:hypothetical protein